jgi:hypothetical protein
MNLIQRVVFVALIFCSLSPVRADDLETGFVTPPDNTKPRCYWYWLDGHISKAGITQDLEAMKRVGIGESYIGMINAQSGAKPNPDLKPLSDPWWDTMAHAIREGTRLGVDIGVFNSPGWSQSGGPWVKPSEAMRYVALPEIRVHGPMHFEGKLPVPDGYFQDIAVLAFPAPAEDNADPGKQTHTPTTVTIEFPSEITARSLTVPPSQKTNVSADFEVSDDGQNYRPITRFTIDRHNLDVNVGPVPLAPVVVSFPATKGRFFKITFSHNCTVGEVRVSPAARVDRFMEKQLDKVFQDPQPPFDYYTWPLQPEPDQTGLMVPPASVQNISTQMSADGTLRWDVPPGDWIVLRAGMRPTGSTNSPAPIEATGLEVDKMNRKHLAAHFDAYIGELIRRVPEAQRKSWKHVVADSYERGPENWTDGFADDFQKSYGYDPLAYLPVMAGRIVGSVDQSDRFLWDLRRLIADRIARDYVGGLHDLCHKYGMKMWLENYGHFGFPSEFLAYGGACDEIAGEFWCGGSLGSIELRDASSAAHTYGKNVVWAEAFTGGPLFVNSPRDLKLRGDWALCQGINQFMLHVYIHQPDDQLPGMSAAFGSEFNRHNTWFEMSKSWIDYQRRCTHLLQHGMHVADVAYFISEDAPKMTGIQQPPLPAGFDFDFINAQVLMTRAAAKDGRLTLSDGMSYRLLVLPPNQTMRPELLAKLAGFVDQGLTIFGPLPSRSPSLQNYPAADAQVRQLSATLKAKVSDGPSLTPALKIEADVAGLPDGKVLFTHRHADDADIYFLSNQTDAMVNLSPVFRVGGKDCEFWHPDTGGIERASAEPVGSATRVKLQLESHGSIFVIFRQNSNRPGTLVLDENQPIKLPAGNPISGPWQVEIAGQQLTFNSLISWTERPEPKVNYFSGTGIYRTKFTASAISPRVVLDLGKVDSIAEISLNGTTFPAVWKYPYEIDVTPAIKPGDNQLEVRVANVWHNRLVGQAREAAAMGNPPAWASWTPHFGPNEKLMSSGLLGPVTLRGAEVSNQK